MRQAQRKNDVWGSLEHPAGVGSCFSGLSLLPLAPISASGEAHSLQAVYLCCTSVGQESALGPAAGKEWIYFPNSQKLSCSEGSRDLLQKWQSQHGHLHGAVPDHCGTWRDPTSQQVHAGHPECVSTCVHGHNVLQDKSSVLLQCSSSAQFSAQ